MGQPVADRRTVILGAGLIGHALAKRSAANGVSTTVITRSPVASRVDGCDYRLSPTGGLGELQDVLRDGDLLLAAHGPALPRASRSEAGKLFAAVTDAAHELVSIVEDHADIRLLWFSSGGMVYGPAAAMPDEMSPLRPTTPYGVAKAAEELILGLVRSDRNSAVGLRCSTVYGRRPGGPTSQGLVDVAIERIKDDEAIHLFGDGSALRGYIHTDDLAEIAIDHIARAADPAPIYNLCSGEFVASADIVTMVEDALGKTTRIQFAEDQTDRDITIDSHALRRDFPEIQFRGIAQGIQDLADGQIT